MKEISEEVYDIAKTLYDDDIIQYTIDRNGKATVDTDYLPDIEDYIYYYGEAKETDFNKALEVITDALDKVKFYDGYLELNDNHTLWNINAPEDDMLFDEDAYSFIVTTSLQDFRAETDTDLYLLGRMGRHAVVDNNFSNLMRYDELKQVQQKYEQEVINQAQETCFYKEDLTEGLAKGEKVTKCQECGSSIIYKKIDLQEDLEGKYIKCPNCSSYVDLIQTDKVIEGKKKYNTMAFAQLLPMSYTDMVDNDIYDDAEEIFDEGGTIEDVKEYYINRFIGYLEDDEEAIEEFNIDLAKDYIEYKLDGWNKDTEGYIPTTDKSLNESELTESKVTESIDEEITEYRLSNKKDNPVWITGYVACNDKVYDVSAKVFMEGSEFGIDEGPISKLWIKNRSAYKPMCNYDRGWDVEPDANNQDTYKAIYDLLIDYRNKNPYDVAEEK